MTSPHPRPVGQLGGLDIEALFAAASPQQGEADDSQEASGRRAGPTWPTENPSHAAGWASGKASANAGLRGPGPLGPSGPPENEGIDTNRPADTLGSGCPEGVFRAGDTGEATQRPALHYRLNDEHNGAGTVIGAPGDTLAELLADLMQRYGQRLDVESVREAFEERAAIMEFDGGMSRTNAEQSAARDLSKQIKVA